MKGLFEIIGITDKENNKRLDGRYPLRINRRCKLHIVGSKVTIEHVPRDGEDYRGLLNVSKMQQLEVVDGIYVIKTMNSIYYFKQCD